MGKDKHTSFKTLAASEKLGEDYDVQSRVVLGSIAAIIAPHGGSIEPWTDRIADEIAGDDFSFYAFRGLKRGSQLHITSSLFDEPRCLGIVGAHERCISIHGWNAAGEKLCVGGRDSDLIDALKRSLALRKINVEAPPPLLQGTDPQNIVNRCASGKGVQLELTMPFRTNRQLIKTFVEAVREALLNLKTQGQR